MTHVSAPDLLALHGVRVLGWASAPAVAARYDLDPDDVTEHLLDAQARGWVRDVGPVAPGGPTGWTPTDAGRAEDGRRLAVELDETGTRGVVEDAHARFVPWNARFTQACTDWQVLPQPWDPLARNDHSDHRWDDRVLSRLESAGRALSDVGGSLAGALSRFDGHADRYLAALARVQAGQHAWVDAPGRDSCHTVWVQVHEDLLSTLGLPRGTGA
ncbi:transcriptional regulator [Thalassiella azotivora]